MKGFEASWGLNFLKKRAITQVRDGRNGYLGKVAITAVCDFYRSSFSRAMNSAQ